MDIYYTNETLYVNLIDEVDSLSVTRMQSRVFNILDDYEIDNVELRVGVYDNGIFSGFINDYKRRYNGNLKIK